jgi:hypothetical protein
MEPVGHTCTQLPQSSHSWVLCSDTRMVGRWRSGTETKPVVGRIMVLLTIPAEPFCLVVSGLRRCKRLPCGMLASLPGRPILDQSSRKVKSRRKNNGKPTGQELVPICSHWITIQRRDGRPASVCARSWCTVVRPPGVSIPCRFRASATVLGASVHGERGSPS